MSLIRTGNLITNPNMNEQELTTLRQIKKDYQNGQYNDLKIHIMYYLGHVPHYCGHEGLVKRLLDNFFYSIEKFETYKKLQKYSILYPTRYNIHKYDDNFIEFVNHIISDIEFDIKYGYR